jgi:hypothetical protein
MVLEPGFRHHHKVRMLVTMTGRKDAPLGLISLWLYCQEKRAWAFRNMTPAKLAGICDWDADPARWHTVLQELNLIDIDTHGVLWVHDWAERNRALIQRWQMGAQKAGYTISPFGPAESGHPSTVDRPTSDREATVKRPTSDREATEARSPLDRSTVALRPPKRVIGLGSKRREEKENSPSGSKRKRSASALAHFLELWEGDDQADLREGAHGDRLKAACLGFIEHRSEMRPPAPMTPRAVELMLLDLRKASPPVATALLEDAVRNSTRGWYWADKAERFAKTHAAQDRFHGLGDTFLDLDDPGDPTDPTWAGRAGWVDPGPNPNR